MDTLKNTPDLKVISGKRDELIDQAFKSLFMDIDQDNVFEVDKVLARKADLKVE